MVCRPFRVLASMVVIGWATMSLPAQAMDVVRVTSPGGIEAWLVEDHANPIVDMEIEFVGGSSQEPADKAGLATLAAGLLDEGAGPYDSQTFQAKLEDMAIELSFSAGHDSFRGHLKTLSRNEDQAFDLFHLALTEPRFDKKPLERVRAQLLSQILDARSRPSSIAARAWFADHFPDHPYGRPVLGTEESVKKLGVADLRPWVAHHLARDTMIVGVCGDITPQQLADRLDTVFGALPPKAAATPVSDVRIAGKGAVRIIDRPIPQSVAIFGAPGLKRDDPDWYAALVMNYILGGGGFSSWMTDEVREKRGLAYSVSTELQPMAHSGLILGSVATRNEKLGQSIEIIRQQWDRMREQGPSDAEIADAKTFLTGSFPLQFDSTTSVAALMVSLQRDHLGIDYLSRRDSLINGVARDDIVRVAKRLLIPGGLDFAVVGHPEGVAHR